MILGKGGFGNFGVAPPPVYSPRAGIQVAGRSGGVFDKRLRTSLPMVNIRQWVRPYNINMRNVQ